MDYAVKQLCENKGMLINRGKIMENTINFYDKLEKVMIDLGFPWNKILWLVAKKNFPWKIRKVWSPNHSSNFLTSHKK